METNSLNRKISPPKSIIDELGRKKTLLQGKFSYILLDGKNFNSLYSRSQDEFSCTKKQILFLGLGAGIEDILPYCEKKEQIFYCEHEKFAEQIHLKVPENFIKLTQKELINLCDKNFFASTDILFYKQNLQLFPGFWNNILIELRNKTLLPTFSQPTDRQNYIFLSGGKNDLLHRELCRGIHFGFFPAFPTPFQVTVHRDCRGYGQNTAPLQLNHI